jgi:hypothetical protein
MTTDPPLEPTPGMSAESQSIKKSTDDSPWSHSNVEISNGDVPICSFMVATEDLVIISHDDDDDYDDDRKPELVESIDEAATSSDDGSFSHDLKVIDLTDASDRLSTPSSDEKSLAQDMKDPNLADAYDPLPAPSSNDGSLTQHLKVAEPTDASDPLAAALSDDASFAQNLNYPDPTDAADTLSVPLSDDGSSTQELKDTDKADASSPFLATSSEDESLTQDLQIVPDASDPHPVVEEHEKQPQKQITSTAEEQQQQIATILHNIMVSVEPHHYTIATHKDPDQPLGLKLWELDQGGMLVMGIADGQANSIFAGATSCVHPVDGDVLIGVNDDSCTSAKTTLMDVKRMVDRRNGQLLTLTFRRPTSKTTKIQQQQQQKKKKTAVDSDGTVQRLTVLNPSEAPLCWNEMEFVGEQNGTSSESEEEGEGNVGDINSDNTKLATQDEKEALILQIKSIDSSSWLSKCTCMAEGQVLLKIQDTPCFEMSPAEARSLLQEELNKDAESLTITTYTPPQISGRNGGLRKAFMGVGGSVLVGAGVAIMATPLHPLGHAMALGGGHVMTYGGMGVISSQLKGPKKKQSDCSKGTSRTFRDRWSNIRRRQQGEGDEPIEIGDRPSMEDGNDYTSSAVEETRFEDPPSKVGVPAVKSASILQRARSSWRRRCADSSLSSQQAPSDGLDDEIKKMEKTLMP